MNKYQKLLGNTVVFGIGQILSKLIGFVLVAVYTRVLAETEYTTLDLLYTTVNMLVPIVTFGMTDAVMRFGMDKAYDCRKVFTSINICVMLGMVILMLFTPLTSNVPKIGEYSFLLYIYTYFSCFRQMASQFVRARGHVKLFMIDGVFSSFTQLILALILMLGFKLGVTGYVLSIVLSDALSLAMLTLFAQLNKYLDLRFFDGRLVRELFKFSAPLIPTYLLWWITSSSDRWFIIGMIGDVEGAIYAVGNKLPTLLLLVTTMFNQAWQMSSIEEKDSRYLGKFYENVFSAYSSLLYIGAAGLIMLVKPLTAILAGTDGDTRYFEAFKFTPILITAMIFQCFCQFLSYIYTTKKRSQNSCATAAVAAVVNAILNFALIPSYGLFGAAIATAAAYFACFAVRLFDTRRYIFFKADYMRLSVNALLIVLMCIGTGTQIKLYWLGNIIGFLVIFVYNLDAVLKTLRRILSRGNTRKAAPDAAE